MSPPPAERGRRAPAHARALVLFIRVYQLTLSALIGRQCRYLPTCSDYAAEAIGLHGAWAGGWMATARLCRCHPWGSWGYDPVPIRCEPASLRPWLYGVWRMRPVETTDQERASSSAARP